jgi:membrane-bound lytic murein transglycosylase B
MKAKQALMVLPILSLIFAAGCSSTAGNVALGAGAAGVAYEASNKDQLDDLERERTEGKISQEEYDRRTSEIKERSLIK